MECAQLFRESGVKLPLGFIGEPLRGTIPLSGKVFATTPTHSPMGVSSLMNDIELACLLLPRGKG